MNVAIIGCGRIGRKRFDSLDSSDRLVVAADTTLSRAQGLVAESPGSIATDNWHAAATHPEVEAVIVSTTNDCLMPITLVAVQAGKHVLVEKPAARTHHELQQVLAAVKQHPVCVWVGFNHRYHPAIQKARAIFDSGVLGTLMYIRGRYGHGGRLGYEREWRADPAIAGGGELLDQGVHLIDLAAWFLGTFNYVSGYAHTYFWDIPVEDNAFLLLRTPKNQVAWLHASCTEWKNLFSFEIYGQSGKIHIEGLGGSYGVERLTHYTVLPQMGEPKTTVWEFPGSDLSWNNEFQAFTAAVRGGALMTRPLHDALATLKIVHAVYRNTQKVSNGFPQATGERGRLQRTAGPEKY